MLPSNYDDHQDERDHSNDDGIAQRRSSVWHHRRHHHVCRTCANVPAVIEVTGSACSPSQQSPYRGRLQRPHITCPWTAMPLVCPPHQGQVSMSLVFCSVTGYASGRSRYSPASPQVIISTASRSRIEGDNHSFLPRKTSDPAPRRGENTGPAPSGADTRAGRNRKPSDPGF
jgi:hypothetical protein